MPEKFKATGRGNFVLDRGNYAISYNPTINDCVSDEILVRLGTCKSRNGRSETALIHERSFLILNGNFCKEYLACKTLEECKAFFEKKKLEPGLWSDFSTDKELSIKQL